MMQQALETQKRRTFAIISHPDAGKTTVTEQLLLYGGAINLAGTVKARKSSRYATADWMQMEKERGISITSAVMQIAYNDCVINLLDTPGHADFSEDTYRTLTAVDSALMVIDVAKGVELRTKKLMAVCRLRTTPIITFINKLDRNGKTPIELLDEIEAELQIKCVPLVWPIGMGSELLGIYHLAARSIRLYQRQAIAQYGEVIAGDSPAAKALLDEHSDAHAMEELALIREVYEPFAVEKFLAGEQTPIFFGSALNNFGIRECLDFITEQAPPPQAYDTQQRKVSATEAKLSGFVFKIQANMDPAHRDRIAFLRLCSGRYQSGMQLHHVRSQRALKISNALTLMAGSRENITQAWPGDVIGLHNHGTIQIGDTFTEGEQLNFIGIPHFAPELFRRVQLHDPLKLKALTKGLLQLSEEGAVQVFRPISSNELILGAVGLLQFDVVAARLKDEYGVACYYAAVNINTARWLRCDDLALLDDFKAKRAAHIAIDSGGHLSYLAPSKVNLELAMERFPAIEFHATREH